MYMNRHDLLSAMRCIRVEDQIYIQSSMLIESIYAGFNLKSSCVVALYNWYGAVVALIRTSHQSGPSWIRVLIYECIYVYDI